MNKSRKIVLRLFLIFIVIVCSACSRNSMVYEMTPSPTSVPMVNEVGDDSKKDEDDVVDKTANLDFNRVDWDGAQVPTDIRKSFMNSKKIVKQLCQKRNEVAKILLEEYKTGIVFHSPKTKIPNNTQDQKPVKKLGIKKLTDKLFEDNNIISVQFLNNGSIDIFFKQDKKDGVIYDRSIGCGEADEIITEYSEIKRIYGNWFYTYSCLDYYN